MDTILFAASLPASLLRVHIEVYGSRNGLTVGGKCTHKKLFETLIFASNFLNCLDFAEKAETLNQIFAFLKARLHRNLLFEF